jgi:steroid delta-isomerase-like uncharacterized protein
LNIHFAAAWLRSICTSPTAALPFYADEFQFEDPPQETLIRNDKAALADCFRPLSNKDAANGLGLHKLEVTDFIGDQNSGLVMWKWSATHATYFFGLRTHGVAIQTTGVSFHVYRDGKIAREIVYSDQIHVAQQLGLPVRLCAGPQASPQHPSAKPFRH